MTVHPAVAVADQFVSAIVWGEHITVWDLMSSAGRDYVLEAGERRGLDAVQAARLRLGTSPQDELDSFLTGLVHGLRVDFGAVQLDEATAVSPPATRPDGRLQVNLECPATFGDHHWAAGSIVLSEVDEAWRVDRVYPLVSRNE